jgi:hypothetical protein
MQQMQVFGSRHTTINRWIARLATLAALIATSSCSVVETNYVAATRIGRCESALGSYTLPKTHIRIQVQGTTTNPKTAVTALTALEEVTVPDTERVYCLDHLASGFASDDIKVFRGDPPAAELSSRSVRTSTQLLSFVSSNSIDYTADIFRRIIRTIFIALSGKPDFTPVARSLAPGITDQDKLYPLADYTFDPFDLAETARVNRDLRPLGFCILLEPGTEGAKFCNEPGRLVTAGAHFAQAYTAYQHAIDAPASVPGIVYRPRQPYRLFVYAKDDPQAPGSWRLVRTMKAMFENISPVISVGVQRAVFAARRTALLFDRGTLVGMCVSKTSELLAATEIPLEVVRSIVALPSQVLLVKIDDLQKTKELVAAETSLISLQQQYLAYLANPKNQKPNDQPGKVSDNSGYTGGPGDAQFTPPFVSDLAARSPDFGTDIADICKAPDRTSPTANARVP